MVYQLLVKGEKVGQYSLKASPAKTAEKVAKVLYEDNGMKGTREFTFEFVKNRTKAEGGDKLYKFRAKVHPTPEPPFGTKEELTHMLKHNPQRVREESNRNKKLNDYLTKYARRFGSRGNDSGWFLRKYHIEVENLLRI